MSRRALIPAIVLALAGCASSPPEDGSREKARQGGVAAVSSDRPAYSRAEEPRRERTADDDRSGRDSRHSRDGRNATDGEDSRARRLRVIEEAASRERPAGSFEARVEREDGIMIVPGGGGSGLTLMPRYALRAVDRKGGDSPDERVLKVLPGPPVELPEPSRPREEKPPEVKPRETPGPLAPREAN